MTTQAATTLHFDPEAERIVSIISQTSEFQGNYKNRNDEGVLIEGFFLGSIDVGAGTVAIAKGATFVGSIKAGKLLNDGRILRAIQEGDYLVETAQSGQSAPTIDIGGLIVLGPNSLTEVDCLYGELEVQRGSRIHARFQVRDVAAEPQPKTSPAHQQTGLAPVTQLTRDRPDFGSPAPVAPLHQQAAS